MKLHFSKVILFASLVFVLTFSAGFAKAENPSISKLENIVFSIQQQLSSLKLQLADLQQKLAAALTADPGTSSAPSNQTATPLAPTATTTPESSTVTPSNSTTTPSTTDNANTSTANNPSTSATPTPASNSDTTTVPAAPTTTPTSPTPSTNNSVANPVPKTNLVNRYLGLGDRDTDGKKDVSVLQDILEKKGFLVMPSGVAKGFYGQLTEAAVKKLQEANGLSKVGAVGPKTLAVLNKLEEPPMDGTCSTCDTLSSPPSLTDFIKKNLTGALAYSPPVDRPSLPNSCIIYRGSNEDASWLWYWRNNGFYTGLLGTYFFLDACQHAVGYDASCSLTNSQINLYANTCNNSYTTTEEKIKCVLGYVKDRLSSDSANVCRHHARCTKKILEAMGISQTYQVGRLGSDGHAWNEVVSEGGTYYIDSYNEIMFWCPAGAR